MRHVLALFGLALVLPLTAAPAFASNVNIALENAHDAELSDAINRVQHGDPAGAEAIFSKVIKDYEAQAKPGQTYRCANDLKDSIAVSTPLMLTAPGDVTVLGPGWCIALWGEGFALIDLNRASEALPFLARAVEMAPTQAHYINEYAEWYKSHHQWQKARDLFTQAWNIVDHDKKGPDRKVAARALRGIAYTTIELGDLTAAEMLFRQSQQFEPDSQAAKSELEYIRQQRERGKNAS